MSWSKGICVPLGNPDTLSGMSSLCADPWPWNTSINWCDGDEDGGDHDQEGDEDGGDDDDEGDEDGGDDDGEGDEDRVDGDGNVVVFKVALVSQSIIRIKKSV